MERFLRWRGTPAVAVVLVLAMVVAILSALSRGSEGASPATTQISAATTTKPLPPVLPYTSTSLSPYADQVSADRVCINTYPIGDCKSVAPQNEQPFRGPTAAYEDRDWQFLLLQNMPWRRAPLQGQLFTADIMPDGIVCIHSFEDYREEGQAPSSFDLQDKRFKIDIAISRVTAKIESLKRDEHGTIVIAYRVYSSPEIQGGSVVTAKYTTYVEEYAFTMGLEPNSKGDYNWVWLTAGACAP